MATRAPLPHSPATHSSYSRLDSSPELTFQETDRRKHQRVSSFPHQTPFSASPYPQSIAYKPSRIQTSTTSASALPLSHPPPGPASLPSSTPASASAPLLVKTYRTDDANPRSQTVASRPPAIPTTLQVQDLVDRFGAYCISQPQVK